MADKHPDEGPLLEGGGCAWLPPPADEDSIPPAPSWSNGRAFSQVWRETVRFGLGGAIAGSRREFPEIRLGKPWKHRPEPHTNVDIDQAIAAKAHINLRLSVVLAEAQLAILEPAQLQALPDWGSADEAMIYAAEAALPASPIFLDFEAQDGCPLAWEQETWPFPFHLRGALCWQRDGLLCVVPFGSVGGRHPWGGNDYLAWARWLYVQRDEQEWPAPGPGDFVARASGEARCWVDFESESICSHQGSVTHNLNYKVLSALKCLEAFDVELVDEPVSRQVRRNAERRGQAIGWVPCSWPLPVARDRTAISLGGAVVVEEHDLASAADCPIPKTHSRLDQAHGHWHEALDAYAEPDLFVQRLNALIVALRSVTFVLQKELRHQPGFTSWYCSWQEKMRADARMAWLVTARNKIEKQGDLDTHSKAHVRIAGDWRRTSTLEIDVDPTDDARAIARAVGVQVPGRSRREDTLIVERRWTVDGLENSEILDALAYCYGFLTRVADGAHRKWGDRDKECALNAESPCGHVSHGAHPSGRLPCMVASREARTARRDLESGALIKTNVQPYEGPAPSREEMEERYGPPISDDGDGPSDVFGVGGRFHEWGRRMLQVDGYHTSFAWLLTPDRQMVQIALYPEDHRDKYLGMEEVAQKVNELGVEEVLFATEAWEAPAVEPGDPRAELRATERHDRREVFMTFALQRGGGCCEWRSSMSRTDAGELALAAMQTREIEPPPFFNPILTVWEEWAN